jgi:hypothetical protein
MTDTNTPDDETTELDAADAAPAASTTTTEVVRERHGFDRRSAGITVGALLALLLAFLVGLAIGHHHGRDGWGDGHFQQMRAQGGGMPFQQRGRGHAGNMRGGAPGMDRGERGGESGGPGRQGGVMGVVTKASSTELTVDPLRGGGGDTSSVTVTLGSDTKVYRQGSDGREDAKVSDIDTGAIVGVRASGGASDGDSSSIAADEVMILRAGDA